MNTGVDRHFPYQVWEDYAMGMLSDQDCEPVEEHLLVCSQCQDLLAEADEYIEIAKAALRPPEKVNRELLKDSRIRRRLAKAVAAATTLTAALLP
jgi:predicted anti-sigma-YlaC factor YlaD